MTGIWRRLHRVGILGDIVILLLLLIYSPTIAFWVIVIESVCKVQGMLLFSDMNPRTKELVRRASICVVIMLCTPVLILNTLLIAAVFLPSN